VILVTHDTQVLPRQSSNFDSPAPYPRLRKEGKLLTGQQRSHAKRVATSDSRWT
jgi:hypothetical protein